MRKTLLILLILGSVCGALTGCGQKGPLTPPPAVTLGTQ
jgi:predicted small lipoprotein YifL